MDMEDDSFGSTLDYCHNIKFKKLMDVDYYTDSKKFFKDISTSSNHLEKVMTGSDSYNWNDYEKDLVDFALPWLTFAIVVFIIWVVAILYRLFNWNLCKNFPTLTSVRRTCLVSSIIFTLGGVVSCALVILYADYAFQSWEQIQCGTAKMPHSLLNGYADTTWIGLNRAVTNTGNIILNMQEQYVPSTNQLWNNQVWPLLLQGIAPVYNSLLNYYNTYSNIQVLNPSPTATQGSTIATDYTANLGPPSTTYSYTGVINLQITQKIAPLLNIYNDLNARTTQEVTNVNNTVDELKVALGKLSAFQSGTNLMKSNVHKWIRNHDDEMRDIWLATSFLTVLIGWTLLGGISLVVYIVMMNRRRYAKVMFGFWGFMGLFSVLGLLGLLYYIAIGISSNDFCRFSEDLPTTEGLSKDYLVKYNIAVPKNSAGSVNECLNGDANLANYTEITDALSWAIQIQADYNTFLSLNSTLAYLSNLTAVTANQNAINQALTFQNVAARTVKSTSTPTYCLSQLNLYSDYSNSSSYQRTSTCTSTVMDRFVTSLANCPVGYVYISANSPNSNVGTPSCLVIPEWTSALLTTRYNEKLVCANINPPFNTIPNAIIQYQTSFNAFMQDTTTKFGNINTGFGVVNGKITELVDNTATMALAINKYFQQDIATLLDEMFGENQGVYNHLMCGYLYGEYQDMHRVVCHNAMPSLMIVFAMMLLGSFLTFLLMIINICLHQGFIKTNF